MKGNHDKFQFIILGNTDSHTLQISDITTESVSSLILLDITIDWKLNFKKHINNIIKKAYYYINLAQDLCGKHIRRKISYIHGGGVFPSQFQT